MAFDGITTAALTAELKKYLMQGRIYKIAQPENDEIMTFGDAHNDYLMVKNAGLGIAMGNAVDSLKKVAKFVTVPNYENGVAYALNKFIFNK